MNHFELQLIFTPPDGAYAPAAALIADPALRADYKVFERCEGGLIVETDDERMFIQDDFDWIVSELLQAAPDLLEQGKNVMFQYRLTEMELEIRADGESLIFADEETEMTVPAAETIAALRKAGSDLQELRKLEGVAE